MQFEERAVELLLLIVRQAQFLSELLNSLRAPLGFAQRRICRCHGAPVAVEIAKHAAQRRAEDKHDRYPQGGPALGGTLVHRGFSARLTRTSSLVGGVVVSTNGSPVMSVSTGFAEVDMGF